MHSAIKKLTLRTLLTVTGALIGILLIIFFVLLYVHKTPAPQAAAQQFPKPITIKADSLVAKAAVIYDPSSGKILYAKNAQVTMPLASLTKLMTAQVALNNIPPSTLITISAKDASVEGDAGDWNLKVGDRMTLGNIIKLGLDASSNHAMSAAAAALGGSYIHDLNKTAGQLGLSHTYFLNSTGLDLTAETSGAYGSAQDVAHLAAAFMRDYPTYFELSTAQSVTVPVSAGKINRQVTANATALPILDMPGIIGVKTGYTDLAGGNLVVAYDLDINHPLIAVVLGSTEEGRFNDVRALITASRLAQE
jgi:serine-type D-Ala-D-Ala carboxypeptidase (penicillin-binding protein 5/6)